MKIKLNSIVTGLLLGGTLAMSARRLTTKW